MSYLHDLVGAGQPVDLLGCLDDARPVGEWLETRILGGIEVLAAVAAEHRELRYITAFGSNATRRAVVERIDALGLAESAWTLVHPAAHVGSDSKLGRGTLVAPGAVVTSGAKVGDHVIINVRASVSHDCDIGDFVNVNPGATLCGNVRVAQGAFVGAGSTVIERRRIGADSIVGAGAVVIRDVPDQVTVAGVPSRVLGRRPAGRG